MYSFPSFKAWRNALLLFIPAYGAVSVIFFFAFWLIFLTFCVLIPWYDPVFLFFLGMALIALLIGSIWYLLVSFLYSRFLPLLWDKPPSWLKSPQSFKQNLAHLGVAIAATFPIAVVYVVYLLWVGGFEALIDSFTEPDIKHIPAPDVMLKLSWLWIIAAAYVYNWKYLLSNKQKRKSK